MDASDSSFSIEELNNAREFLKSLKYAAGNLSDESFERFMNARGICAYCGEKLHPADTKTDHIVPWNKGGDQKERNALRDDPKNKLHVHGNCHWIKTTYLDKNWVRPTAKHYDYNIGKGKPYYKNPNDGSVISEISNPEIMVKHYKPTVLKMNSERIPTEVFYHVATGRTDLAKKIYNEWLLSRRDL